MVQGETYLKREMTEFKNMMNGVHNVPTCNSSMSIESSSEANKKLFFDDKITKVNKSSCNNSNISLDNSTDKMKDKAVDQIMMNNKTSSNRYNTSGISGNVSNYWFSAKNSRLMQKKTNSDIIEEGKQGVTDFSLYNNTNNSKTDISFRYLEENKNSKTPSDINTSYNNTSVNAEHLNHNSSGIKSSMSNNKVKRFGENDCNENDKDAGVNGDVGNPKNNVSRSNMMNENENITFLNNEARANDIHQSGKNVYILPTGDSNKKGEIINGKSVDSNYFCITKDVNVNVEKNIPDGICNGYSNATNVRYGENMNGVCASASNINTAEMENGSNVRGLKGNVKSGGNEKNTMANGVGMNHMKGINEKESKIMHGEIKNRDKNNEEIDNRTNGDDTFLETNGDVDYKAHSSNKHRNNVKNNNKIDSCGNKKGDDHKKKNSAFSSEGNNSTNEAPNNTYKLNSLSSNSYHNISSISSLNADAPEFVPSTKSAQGNIPFNNILWSNYYQDLSSPPFNNVQNGSVVNSVSPSATATNSTSVAVNSSDPAHNLIMHNVNGLGNSSLNTGLGEGGRGDGNTASGNLVNMVNSNSNSCSNSIPLNSTKMSVTNNTAGIINNASSGIMKRSESPNIKQNSNMHSSNRSAVGSSGNSAIAANVISNNETTSNSVNGMKPDVREGNTNATTTTNNATSNNTTTGIEVHTMGNVNGINNVTSMVGNAAVIGNMSNMRNSSNVNNPSTIHNSPEIVSGTSNGAGAQNNCNFINHNIMHSTNNLRTTSFMSGSENSAPFHHIGNASHAHQNFQPNNSMMHPPNFYVNSPYLINNHHNTISGPQSAMFTSPASYGNSIPPTNGHHEIPLPQAASMYGVFPNNSAVIGNSSLASQKNAGLNIAPYNFLPCVMPSHPQLQPNAPINMSSMEPHFIANSTNAHMKIPYNQASRRNMFNHFNNGGANSNVSNIHSGTNMSEANFEHSNSINTAMSGNMNYGFSGFNATQSNSMHLNNESNSIHMSPSIGNNIPLNNNPGVICLGAPLHMNGSTNMPPPHHHMNNVNNIGSMSTMGNVNNMSGNMHMSSMHMNHNMMNNNNANINKQKRYNSYNERNKQYNNYRDNKTLGKNNMMNLNNAMNNFNHFNNANQNNVGSNQNASNNPNNNVSNSNSNNNNNNNNNNGNNSNSTIGGNSNNNNNTNNNIHNTNNASSTIASNNTSISGNNNNIKHENKKHNKYQSSNNFNQNFNLNNAMNNVSSNTKSMYTKNMKSDNYVNNGNSSNNREENSNNANGNLNYYHRNNTNNTLNVNNASNTSGHPVKDMNTEVKELNDDFSEHNSNAYNNEGNYLNKGKNYNMNNGNTKNKNNNNANINNVSGMNSNVHGRVGNMMNTTMSNTGTNFVNDGINEKIRHSNINNKGDKNMKEDYKSGRNNYPNNINNNSSKNNIGNNNMNNNKFSEEKNMVNANKRGEIGRDKNNKSNESNYRKNYSETGNNVGSNIISNNGVVGANSNEHNYGGKFQNEAGNKRNTRNIDNITGNNNNNSGNNNNNNNKMNDKKIKNEDDKKMRKKNNAMNMNGNLSTNNAPSNMENNENVNKMIGENNTSMGMSDVMNPNNTNFNNNNVTNNKTIHGSGKGNKNYERKNGEFTSWVKIAKTSLNKKKENGNGNVNMNTMDINTSGNRNPNNINNNNNNNNVDLTKEKDRERGYAHSGRGNEMVYTQNEVMNKDRQRKNEGEKEKEGHNRNNRRYHEEKIDNSARSKKINYSSNKEYNIEKENKEKQKSKYDNRKGEINERKANVVALNTSSMNSVVSSVNNVGGNYGHRQRDKIKIENVEIKQLDEKPLHNATSEVRTGKKNVEHKEAVNVESKCIHEDFSEDSNKKVQMGNMEKERGFIEKEKLDNVGNHQNGKINTTLINANKNEELYKKREGLRDNSHTNQSHGENFNSHENNLNKTNDSNSKKNNSSVSLSKENLNKINNSSTPNAASCGSLTNYDKASTSSFTNAKNSIWKGKKSFAEVAKRKPQKDMKELKSEPVRNDAKNLNTNKNDKGNKKEHMRYSSDATMREKGVTGDKRSISKDMKKRNTENKVENTNAHMNIVEDQDKEQMPTDCIKPVKGKHMINGSVGNIKAERKAVKNVPAGDSKTKLNDIKSNSKNSERKEWNDGKDNKSKSIKGERKERVKDVEEEKEKLENVKEATTYSNRGCNKINNIEVSIEEFKFDGQDKADMAENKEKYKIEVNAEENMENKKEYEQEGEKTEDIAQQKKQLENEEKMIENMDSNKEREVIEKMEVVQEANSVVEITKQFDKTDDEVNGVTMNELKVEIEESKNIPDDILQKDHVQKAIVENTVDLKLKVEKKVSQVNTVTTDIVTSTTVDIQKEKKNELEVEQETKTTDDNIVVQTETKVMEDVQNFEPKQIESNEVIMESKLLEQVTEIVENKKEVAQEKNENVQQKIETVEQNAEALLKETEIPQENIEVTEEKKDAPEENIKIIEEKKTVKEPIKVENVEKREDELLSPLEKKMKELVEEKDKSVDEKDKSVYEKVNKIEKEIGMANSNDDNGNANKNAYNNENANITGNKNEDTPEKESSNNKKDESERKGDEKDEEKREGEVDARLAKMRSQRIYTKNELLLIYVSHNWNKDARDYFTLHGGGHSVLINHITNKNRLPHGTGCPIKHKGSIRDYEGGRNSMMLNKDFKNLSGSMAMHMNNSGNISPNAVNNVGRNSHMNTHNSPSFTNVNNNNNTNNTTTTNNNSNNNINNTNNMNLKRYGMNLNRASNTAFSNSGGDEEDWRKGSVAKNIMNNLFANNSSNNPLFNNNVFGSNLMLDSINQNNSGINNNMVNNFLMKNITSNSNDWRKSDGEKLKGFFDATRVKDPVDNWRKSTPTKTSETSWLSKQNHLKADKYTCLMRKLRGILNKLTFEKFDLLYAEIINVGFSKSEEVIGLLKLVFEKAISQHHFVQMYVQLCKKLSKHFLSVQFEDGKDFKFRKILINQCQDSFEKNLKPIEYPPNLEGDEKFEFEQMHKNKVRGNMLFVGELVKSGIISIPVVFVCIDQLLDKRKSYIEMKNDTNEGNLHLEALCMFLNTIGEILDTHERAKQEKVAALYETLNDLVNDEKIVFRVRCLIKDVIENRNEKWNKKFAHKLEGPTTLSDLHDKVLKENIDNSARNFSNNNMGGNMNYHENRLNSNLNNMRNNLMRGNFMNNNNYMNNMNNNTNNMNMRGMGVKNVDGMKNLDGMKNMKKMAMNLNKNKIANKMSEENRVGGANDNTTAVGNMGTSNYYDMMGKNNLSDFGRNTGFMNEEDNSLRNLDNSRMNNNNNNNSFNIGKDKSDGKGFSRNYNMKKINELMQKTDAMNNDAYGDINLIRGGNTSNDLLEKTNLLNRNGKDISATATSADHGASNEDRLKEEEKRKEMTENDFVSKIIPQITHIIGTATKCDDWESLTKEFEEISIPAHFQDKANDAIVNITLKKFACNENLEKSLEYFNWIIGTLVLQNQYLSVEAFKNSWKNFMFREDVHGYECTKEDYPLLPTIIKNFISEIEKNDKNSLIYDAATIEQIKNII